MDIAAATDELVRDQHDNGGWSQLPALEPDAYATGLTLLALHQGGGISVTDARYIKGVKFLLDTSREEGAWHVKSRSFASQPYFESGFPFEHDQWISAAASGTENLMPHILTAVESQVTVGEISNALRAVWGEYRESITV